MFKVLRQAESAQDHFDVMSGKEYVTAGIRSLNIEALTCLISCKVTSLTRKPDTSNVKSLLNKDFNAFCCVACCDGTYGFSSVLQRGEWSS